MSKKLYEEMTAGTMADSSTQPKLNSSSQTIAKPHVSRRLSVYEYIWSKAFPSEEFNYDDFYDWSRENSNYALSLALEYCDLNGG